MTDPAAPRSGRFRLTADDMAAAARLHQLASVITPRGLAFNLGLVLAVATGIFLYTKRPDGGFGAWLVIAGGVLGYFVTVCIIGILVLVLVVAPKLGRRQFREQKNLAEELEFSLDGKVYAVMGATSRSALPWSDYLKWTENEELMLLHVSSYYYQILPKRALAPEDVAAIRVYLSAAGVPAATALRWAGMRTKAR